MLQEKGRVFKVEPDAIWVETIQRSTCGQCSARKGCGQHLLSEIGASTAKLRVIKGTDDNTFYRVGQNIILGIPENSVVIVSLLAYLIPLVLTIVFLIIGHTLNINELSSVVLGIMGLSVGMGAVYVSSRYLKDDSRLQPMIIPIKTESEKVSFAN